MAVEFYVHKMSEHMDEAEIIQWLVNEGDAVAEHQPVIEVMTDKFTVEVEAPVAGILAGVRPGCVKGAVVPVGEPIAYIVQRGETAPALPSFGAATAAAGPAAVAHLPATQPAETIDRVRSTPVARRMAKDVGVDIEQVKGSGPGGRVIEADIRGFAQARESAAAPSSVHVVEPAPTVATPAPLETFVTAQAPAAADSSWQELTAVQRITGERMRESVVNAPQFALDMRADATNLLWLREALYERTLLEARTPLTLTGLLVKIVAAALMRHPRANSEYDGGRVRMHDTANVGVAVGTDSGLVVPVIKHVERKELGAVVGELAAFQEKARTMRFTPEDLAGGTFTVSNLGMFGVERFNAIINPPQSAVLAVGAVVKTPVAGANDTVVLKPLVILTLTIDHRVMDGLQGARFLGEIKEKIEKPFFLI